MNAVNQNAFIRARFSSVRGKKGKKRGRAGNITGYTHTFGINLLQIGLELSGIARDA